MKNTSDHSVGALRQEALFSQGFVKQGPVPAGRAVLVLVSLGCLG